MVHVKSVVRSGEFIIGISINSALNLKNTNSVLDYYIMFAHKFMWWNEISCNSTSFTNKEILQIKAAQFRVRLIKTAAQYITNIAYLFFWIWF